MIGEVPGFDHEDDTVDRSKLEAGRNIQLDEGQMTEGGKQRAMQRSGGANISDALNAQAEKADPTAGVEADDDDPTVPRDLIDHVPGVSDNS